MNLYTAKEKLKIVKEKPYKLEREIQSLFENNLITLMGLQQIRVYHQEQTNRYPGL